MPISQNKQEEQKNNLAQNLTLPTKPPENLSSPPDPKNSDPKNGEKIQNSENISIADEGNDIAAQIPQDEDVFLKFVI